MLIELDKILDITVNATRNEINYKFLNILLREILHKLDLVGHSIEVEDELEFVVQQHDVSINELEEAEYQEIPVIPSSTSKQLKSASNSEDDLHHLSEEIVCIRNSEHSLSAFFDIVNIVKRLDALEFGIRELSDALQRNQIRVQSNLSEQVNPGQNEPVETADVLTSLSKKIDWLSDEMRKFNCKCNDDINNIEDDENGKVEEEEKITVDNSTERNDISRNVEKVLLSLQSDVDDIKNSLKNTEEEENQFMKSASKQLETFRDDLINCLCEIQEMMDCKVDKCHVQDLKTFIDEKIAEATSIGEKIRKAAAGTTRALISDVNCISCGENVVQIDTTSSRCYSLPTRQPFLVGKIENRQQSTRHCGGKF